MTEPAGFENCTFFFVDSAKDVHRAPTPRELFQKKREEFRAKVVEHFEEKCQFAYFSFEAKGMADYTAKITFREERDRRRCEKSGVLAKLIEYVRQALAHDGFTAADTATIEIGTRPEEDRRRTPAYIPSKEAFARAEQASRDAWRNLTSAAQNIERRISSIAALHDFVLMPHRKDVEFWAVVFFETDQQVAECRESGVARQIMDVVYDELERADRGKRPDITVYFEFDSDENVRVRYQGRYQARLR